MKAIIWGILVSFAFLLVGSAARIVSAEPASTSTVTILEDTQTSIAETIQLVRSATKSIDLMYYQIKEDQFSALLTLELAHAASRGLKVRIIYDDYESKITSETVTWLSRLGVDIKAYRPFRRRGLIPLLTENKNLRKRMHDKLLITDRQAVKTGDRNIGDTYYDLAHGKRFQFVSREYIVRGPSSIPAANHFEKFWQSDEVEWALSLSLKSTEQGIENRALVQKRIAEVEQLASGLTLVSSTPKIFTLEKMPSFFGDVPSRSSGPGITAKVILDAIRNAKKSIVIENPYMILTDEMEDAIRTAIRNNVKVEILTNGGGSFDEAPAENAYSFGRRKLISMGVHLLERRVPGKTFHQKTLIIDGELTIITSYNMDPRSQNLNTESGFRIYDRAFAAEVRSKMNIYQDVTQELLAVSNKGILMNGRGGMMGVDFRDFCSGLVTKGITRLLRSNL